MNKETKIKAYGLRFYVRDFYIKNAGSRGGELFKPNYKKDKKPFETRVKYAVNMSAIVLKNTSIKYPVTLN